MAGKTKVENNKESKLGPTLDQIEVRTKKKSSLPKEDKSSDPKSQSEKVANNEPDLAESDGEKTKDISLEDTSVKKDLNQMPDWIRFGFPPPEFLRFNFIGLNISDHSIKVCKSAIEHDSYLIDFIDTISLPEGAIVNGQIIKPEEVISVLRKIKETYGVEFVRVSIPEEKIYLATFTIPPTTTDKLRSVIEFHIGDHIPLSVDEIQFDYNVVNRNQLGKVIEVVVIAVSREIANEILSLLNESDLIPLSMEVEAQAIARVIVPPNNKKTSVVLDIGRSRTGISIIKNQVVRYTTTISFGGDSIVNMLAKSRGITVAEAEEVKQTVGFNMDKYSESEQQELNEFMSSLIQEITLRENYWATQSGEGLDEVLLVGGNASTPNLANYLQSKTQKIVRIPDIWANIFSNKNKERPVSINESLGYAAVVGLSINEEK